MENIVSPLNKLTDVLSFYCTSYKCPWTFVSGI